eukprot:tig00000955_g5809.t1
MPASSVPSTPRALPAPPLEPLAQVKAVVEQLRAHAECPVCLTVYRDPRILPACAHTLCADCCEKILAGGRIKCPQCRATSDLLGREWRGLHGARPELQRNHAIAVLSDSLQQQLRLLAIAEGIARRRAELALRADRELRIRPASSSSPAAAAAAPSDSGSDSSEEDEEDPEGCGAELEEDEPGRGPEEEPELFGEQREAALRRVDGAAASAAASARARAAELRAAVDLYERAWLAEAEERAAALRAEVAAAAAAAERAARADLLSLLAIAPGPAAAGVPLELLEAALAGTLPERVAPPGALHFGPERLELVPALPRAGPAGLEDQICLLLFLWQEDAPHVCLLLAPDLEPHQLPEEYELFARARAEVPAAGIALESPFGGLAWDREALRRKTPRGWLAVREARPLDLEEEADAAGPAAVALRLALSDVALRPRGSLGLPRYPFL